MSDRPRRAELWWCEPPEIGRRPVVVLSRDAAIQRLRRVLIAPCTTTIRGLSSEAGESTLEKLGRREYALLCIAAGALLLAILPILLHYLGTLWRPGARPRAAAPGDQGVAREYEGGQSVTNSPTGVGRERAAAR